MIIDAHQHFWSVKRTDYGWLTPDLEPLYRDFQPEDLNPELDQLGIGGTVLVQAAPTMAETSYMLDLAKRAPFIKGVVGWVDFESPSAASDIARLAQEPLLKGLRPMIQDIADDNWMLRPDLAPAFQAMIDHGLAFDALTLPRHLPNLLTLLKRYPALRTVIDHGSKPAIATQETGRWYDDMSRLAEETNAFCKFSGLVTEAGNDWSKDKLRPFSDALFASFGAKRLIWGSDWPVCLLASGYRKWYETARGLMPPDAQTQKEIFGKNACEFYKLDVALS